MSDELKNILSEDAEQEKLLQYLNSKLSVEDQYALETKMNDDEFINDAVEGLQQVENKKHINGLISQLNADLKIQLNKKKARKEKRRLKTQSGVYYTMIILIILVIVAYIIIKMI